MKKYIFALFCAASLLSCNKLDEVIYSQLTDENAFSSAENALAAVNSCYAPMHNLYREPVFYVNDIASDCGYKNGNCFEVMNDNAIYNDNRTLNIWNGFFQIAARANIVIDNVPGMSETLFTNAKISKEAVLGQAYFLRAYAYLNLTDIFYRVPLVTDSKIDAAERCPLATLAAIEMRIENDLFEAKDLLPKSYPTREDAGRPTYAAACGYLTRLYMRQAGRVRQDGGDDSEYWKYALDEVNNVLALEGSYYNLQPTVWGVFDPTSEATLYNDELIWAIRASGTITSGSWDLGLQFTGWEYDMGWGNMYQPLEMTWKFNTKDQRLSKLQVTGYEDIYTPDKTYFKAPESVEQTGSVSKNHTIGMKTYSEMKELEETYTQKYKFTHPGEYIYDCPNNFPLLRLSDMILCKAEILNELYGPTQEAVDLVNRIRERAFQNQNYNLNLADYADKDEFRLALCDERMFELNMEGMRRTDLIRMGLWKEKMQEYINTIHLKYQWREINEGQPSGYYNGMFAAYPDAASLQDRDIRMYMPIPYREVLLNPDLSSARDDLR